MKILNLLFIASLLLISSKPILAVSPKTNTVGRILLQVEKNGEAWYVYPKSNFRYFLGRPADAFSVMRKLGLGAKHDFITKSETFSASLSGLILLDVENHGEAYYINPIDLKKHYLGRPSDAFALMRELGLGISNIDIEKIPVGDINNYLIDSTTKNLKTNTELIDNKVPFVSQAPFGDWKDERQQDGCEEASALMAVAWARGDALSKEKALREVLNISDFEKKKYGEYRDIATSDALDWIYKDYLGFENAELKNNITVDDIIGELRAGKIVVAPMNGQELGNPNFTAPGPERHMLVIRGYDFRSKEFITNDPGTRHGEAYRYKKDILYKAIRNYETGYHELIQGVRRDIIVIKK